MMYNTISNQPKERATITHPWVYWDDAFSSIELSDIIRYCEQFKLDSGTTFGSETKEQAELWRISNVGFHERNNDTAWIFDRLNDVITKANNAYYGFDLNGYQSFQYTTYTDTQKGHYDWHMDSEIGHEPYGLEIRKLSLTLLLNDEFEGGKFHINTGSEHKSNEVPAIKGRCIFFPSFMIHRVAPVTRGVRKSLVVWVTGPKFK
jgi:PKHD-type hydroxylase